jgi:asparagine synthetase B (glutamine-hydrolysing)
VLLEHTLSLAVADQAIADLRLGAFLSGGIVPP